MQTYCVIYNMTDDNASFRKHMNEWREVFELLSKCVNELADMVVMSLQ